MAKQRLIDAEAFHKFIEKQDEGADYTIYHFEEWLEQQPTIEAKPIIHAHWTGSDGTYCSHCERSYMDVADADSWESGDIPDFCPYCGAQMDEEINNG